MCLHLKQLFQFVNELKIELPGMLYMRLGPNECRSDAVVYSPLENSAATIYNHKECNLKSNLLQKQTNKPIKKKKTVRCGLQAGHDFF